MNRIALLAASLFATPALAQGWMPGMPGMAPPAAPPAAASQAAGHDMSSMPGMTMPPADAHAGHDMSSMPGMAMPGMAMPQAPAAAPAQAAIPQTPPPPVPTDHLADRYFDPTAMAAARRQLGEEHGGAVYSKVMANLLEYQGGGGGGYRWDGEAFYGGDIDRFVAKTEGAGNGRTGLGSAEAQALYSHAIGRYFDLQAGVRQDFTPGARTYLTVGTQGLLPYWFNVQAALFVSTRGEVLGRLEGSYDLRLTQRLVLQPRAELNLAAQDTRQTRTGSGLSDAELGLRLRYEVRREFAPYVGVSYERMYGNTATFARRAGDDAGGANLVVGIQAWF